MAGMYFYWFGWMFWLIVHFFWSTSKKQFWSGLFILLCLTTIPVKLTVIDQSISFTFIMVAIFLCWEIRHHQPLKLLYYIIVSWTVGAAYSAFRLIILFDPILSIVDERWMSAFLVFIISYVLADQLKVRFVLSVFGFLTGDFLLSFILKHHIGSLLLFDKIAISSFFYGVVWCLATLSQWLNRLVQSKVTDSTYRHIS